MATASFRHRHSSPHLCSIRLPSHPFIPLSFVLISRVLLTSPFPVPFSQIRQSELSRRVWSEFLVRSFGQGWSFHGCAASSTAMGGGLRLCPLLLKEIHCAKKREEKRKNLEEGLRLKEEEKRNRDYIHGGHFMRTIEICRWCKKGAVADNSSRLRFAIQRIEIAKNELQNRIAKEQEEKSSGGSDAARNSALLMLRIMSRSAATRNRGSCVWLVRFTS